MPSVRNLLISRSTSTCLCIACASTIPPASLRFLASWMKDSTTGACATSWASPRSESKYERQSALTAPGSDKYASYCSSMNGALPPKSVLFCSYSRIMDMASPARYGLDRHDQGRSVLALGHRRDVASHRTGVELPRPADLLVGIRDHFVPLRDPADRPRQREYRREQAHRDSQRTLDNTGIEIDVRVQLARHEVVVFERDFFQRHRQLEQRIVVQPEILEHFVAGLAHQLGARVVILVHTVAEAHQLD